MQDWKLLDREQRAVLLAATAKIKNVGDKWLVPSQSESGIKYVVDLGGESPHCNCPDHEIRACRCKHLIAVEIVRQRELFEDGSETGHANRNRDGDRPAPDLSAGLESVQRRADDGEAHLPRVASRPVLDDRKAGPTCGRPRLPLSDAIFSAVFKVY